MQPAHTIRKKELMNQYSQAPHVEGPSRVPSGAPNAALLIDFDNVTLGMRSDLSKELKTLLQSDVIRGKVTVQRAYADWRRYPQYIVPLSEASVDLIFAPAYGSSKKNATDIRMAIDGMELVFVRPEIGTYILLTGDSDFSSLVLKLKEYGKYVIGVGIEESSSDILVQNCDEYYSYTSLTGLRKTTDTVGKPADPWELVAEALARMTKRKDVMRSDRLKQVMIEIDSTFDEGGFGFSKFSKFLAEAASRGIMQIHKLVNGQYEVKPVRKGTSSSSTSSSSTSSTRERKGRGPAPRRTRSDRTRSDRPSRSEPAHDPDSEQTETNGDPLRAAYDLMLDCLRMLKEKGRNFVRDSDVKRKMLERNRGFDEAELGFAKFSKFLMQAEEHDVVNLEKTETGNYRVSLKEGDAGDNRADTPSDAGDEVGRSDETGASREAPEVLSAPEPPRTTESQAQPESRAVPEPRVEPSGQSSQRSSAGRLGPRGGSGRRRDEDGPVLFEGQGVSSRSSSSSPAPSGFGVAVRALGLPTGAEAMVSYLTTSYKGVGTKTAEALVEAFGDSLFEVFQDTPQRVNDVVPRRAEQVLAEWRTDYARRSEGAHPAKASAPAETGRKDESGDRGGRGGRQPRGERQSQGGRPSQGERPSQVERQSRDDRPREPQSDAAGGDDASQTASSSRPTPRGRGGARRTRRSSRGGSSGSDSENG